MSYTYAHLQHPWYLTSTAVTSTAIVSTRMFCFLRTRHVESLLPQAPLTRDRRITIIGTAPASRRSEINEPNISTLFWPKLCRLRTTKLYVSVFRNRLWFYQVANVRRAFPRFTFVFRVLSMLRWTRNSMPATLNMGFRLYAYRFSDRTNRAKIAFYLVLESNFGRKSSCRPQAIIGGRLTRCNLKLHLRRVIVCVPKSRSDLLKLSSICCNLHKRKRPQASAPCSSYKSHNCRHLELQKAQDNHHSQQVSYLSSQWHL